MEIFFYIYIFIFGTLFGSFSSVIISRLKNNKSGIFTGRSECPNCNHKLGMLDLIPIFSFLFSKGKCKYCFKKISFIYPILELCSGLLFFLVSYLLVDINLVLIGNFLEISKLVFYLLFSFLTIIYVFYDILYLEIPDSILFSLIFITFSALGIQSYFGYNIIGNDYSQLSPIQENTYLFVSLLVTIGLFYVILLKGLKEIYDFIIIGFILGIIVFLKYFLGIDIENTILGSALLGMFLSFLFFFIQIVISGGKWMGGGDLRIAILLGLILGYSYYFYGILVSYFVGAVIGVFFLVYKKTREYYLTQRNYLNKIRKILGLRITRVDVDTQIPFGPFLAIGIFIMLFFGQELIDIFETLYL